MIDVSVMPLSAHPYRCIPALLPLAFFPLFSPFSAAYFLFSPATAGGTGRWSPRGAILQATEMNLSVAGAALGGALAQLDFELDTLSPGWCLLYKHKKAPERDDEDKIIAKGVTTHLRVIVQGPLGFNCRCGCTLLHLFGYRIISVVLIPYVFIITFLI